MDTFDFCQKGDLVYSRLDGYGIIHSGPDYHGYIYVIFKQDNCISKIAYKKNGKLPDNVSPCFEQILFYRDETNNYLIKRPLKISWVKIQKGTEIYVWNENIEMRQKRHFFAYMPDEEYQFWVKDKNDDIASGYKKAEIPNIK